jgi:hypothetical protein
MRMYLLIFPMLIFSRQIKLNILYEKQVEKTVGETYKIYMLKLIEKFDIVLRQIETGIKLVNILPFNIYSEDPKYNSITRLAGGNDIKARLEAMSKLDIDGILILAATTRSEDDATQYGQMSPCRGKYIINLNSKSNAESDFLTSLLAGTLDLLSEIHGFKVPNLLDNISREDMKKFFYEVLKSDLKTRIDACTRNEEKLSGLSEGGNLDPMLDDDLEKSKSVRGRRTTGSMSWKGC